MEGWYSHQDSQEKRIKKNPPYARYTPASDSTPFTLPNNMQRHNDIQTLTVLFLSFPAEAKSHTSKITNGPNSSNPHRIIIDQES